jgi:hypothetical protein
VRNKKNIHHDDWLEFYNNFGKNPIVPRQARIYLTLLLLALIMLPNITGCHSASFNFTNTQEKIVSTADWKQTSIGRADILLPPGSKVFYTTTEINDIYLSQLLLPPNEPFQKAWESRLEQIRSGDGITKEGRSSIFKTYPSTGQGFTVLFMNYTPDTKAGYTLEHWQQFGGAIYVGVSSTSKEDISITEHLMDEDFAHLAERNHPLSKSDFAIEDATIQLPYPGSESTDLDVNIEIPGAPGHQPVRAHLSMQTAVMTRNGTVNVIKRGYEVNKNTSSDGKMKIYRAGNRTLSGLPGEEFSYIFNDRSRSDKFRTSFNAEWGFGGIGGSGSAPQTSLHMSVDSVPLDFDVNLIPQYWDTIANSLRYR